jgi:hypothetical protein
LFNAETAHSLATMITEMLNAAIKEFDKDDFAKALSGIMSFIGTLLSELAEQVNTDEFIDKIVYGINESIDNGSVQKLAKGLTEFVVKLFDSLKKIIKDTDKSGLLQAIWDGFTEGGGMSLLGDWATFVFAPFLIGALAKAIAVYGGTKLLLGKAFKKAMSTALQEAGLGELAETAVETTGKFSGLTSVLKPLAKILGTIGGAIMVFDGVNKQLSEGITLANTLESVLGGALLGFSIAGPLGALAGGLTTALFSLDQFGKQYPEKVAEIGEKVGNTIGKFIVWEEGIFDDARQWIADYFDGVGSDIGEKIVKAVTSVQNLANWFTDTKTKISDAMNQASASISQTMANIETWFNNGLTNIRAGIEQAKVDINTRVDEIINNIHQSFTNFVQNAFTLGENIIKGIADGISSGIGWVRDKVDSIVNEIESRFSSGLRIFSPSRVMRDLAIYVPEGVALGIEDGEPYVESAMNDMLNSIKFSDFFNESLDETTAFVSSVSDKLAEIETPTLDSLKYQSKLLSNPASTARTLSQSYADNAGQRTDGVLSGIYNRMITAGQASGRNVIVDVYLDKNNRLGEYIIDTMKGNVVMTGGV